MLITGGSGHVEVSLYNSVSNTMDHYGKVPIKDVIGWTLRNYDWNKYMAKKNPALVPN